MISDLHIEKWTSSCQEIYLTGSSVILDTVQLPVKNQLYLGASSDDLY